MVVGVNDIKHYDDALIVAIRNTTPEFLEVLARLDMLYMTVGFAGLFMGISILMTLSTEFLSRMLAGVHRVIIAIALGILTFGSYFVVSGIKDYGKIADDVGTYMGIALCMIVPTILLIIAKIKNPDRKKKNTQPTVKTNAA